MDDATSVPPLHLQTVETVCDELVSGRSIGVGPQNTPFALDGEASRSVLNWYRQNRAKWGSNVSGADAEAIVAAAMATPPVVAQTVNPAAGSRRRLALHKLEAHRFAGLHVFGTASAAPPNFVFEPSPSVTVFEGWNGSGKTSLLNAVIWCLTGQLLRPQRPPESGSEEFECQVDAVGEGDPPTSHKLSSVTPLPDPQTFRPDGSLPADTWVELTFVDDQGALLPPIRRTQTRSNRGKIEEIAPNLTPLGLDPISVRLATTMPGMLQFIQIGATNELGKAVTELTGLAPLVSLAGHARRVLQNKVRGDFKRDRERDIENADLAFSRASDDLRTLISNRAVLTGAPEIPQPTEDEAEAKLAALKVHFEAIRTSALEGARSELGESFDPSDPTAFDDLVTNLGPALMEAKRFGATEALTRLRGLADLDETQVGDVQRRVAQVIADADILSALAAAPQTAARQQLYARVAAWEQENPDAARANDMCTVCGEDLEGKIDTVTGGSVMAHLDDARGAQSALLSQTLGRWSQATLAELARDLPLALQGELSSDRLSQPSEIFVAGIEQLFKTEPFEGALGALKGRLLEEANRCLVAWPRLVDHPDFDLPTRAGTEHLETALRRLGRAIHLIGWRKNADQLVEDFRAVVLGRPGDDDIAATTLVARLMVLQSVVEGAEPITNALSLCDRLSEDLNRRRIAERKLNEYVVAGAALEKVIALGGLAETQVEQLRRALQGQASAWRRRIYEGAFPSTRQDLLYAQMNSAGQLDFLVGARGVAAGAQHVANASALRATLVGFFLAFWEHVLLERGGLKLLVLDDPQELLDGENRQRLADALPHLVEIGGQIFMSTYEARFASHIAANARALPEFKHVAVLPVSKLRPTIETPPAVLQLNRVQEAYDGDPDDTEKAQALASETRVFIECRLADFFDDAAYPAWVATTHKPTLADHLNRIRGLVSTPPNDLFRTPALVTIANEANFRDTSPTIQLLNKAHHRKEDIRPGDVAPLAAALRQMRKMVEEAHQASRIWRRGGAHVPAQNGLPDISVGTRPSFRFQVHPDLAAFTAGAPHGESQANSETELTDAWFEGKSFYYLRADNFGFAGPSGCIAIVQTVPSSVSDRNLVVARRGQSVYARRLLRSSRSGWVALAAETPDPRRSAPTLMLPEAELALHEVVGILFDPSHPAPVRVSGEAVQIEDAPVLRRLTSAYRVREDSAIPLALPRQIALGGPAIGLSDLGFHEGQPVALNLEDGTCLFKRVGPTLGGSLSHLRQFESLGGLGASLVLSVGESEPPEMRVRHARAVIGVLYHG